MQYYTFELNKESQELCVIITPFGRYKYKCFLKGFKYTLDFAQHIMAEVLYGLDNVKVYLDNIGLFAIIKEELLLLTKKVCLVQEQIDSLLTLSHANWLFK